MNGYLLNIEKGFFNNKVALDVSYCSMGVGIEHIKGVCGRSIEFKGMFVKLTVTRLYKQYSTKAITRRRKEQAKEDIHGKDRFKRR